MIFFDMRIPLLEVERVSRLRGGLLKIVQKLKKALHKYCRSASSFFYAIQLLSTMYLAPGFSS